ncbi:hypothetical protein D3C73_1184030 [compost metagenome]
MNIFMFCSRSRLFAAKHRFVIILQLSEQVIGMPFAVRDNDLLEHSDWILSGPRPGLLTGHWIHIYDHVPLLGVFLHVAPTHNQRQQTVAFHVCLPNFCEVHCSASLYRFFCLAIILAS